MSWDDRCLDWRRAYTLNAQDADSQLKGRLEPLQTLFPGQRPGLDQSPSQHAHGPRAEPGSPGGKRQAQVKPRKCERCRVGTQSSAPTSPERRIETGGGRSGFAGCKWSPTPGRLKTAGLSLCLLLQSYPCSTPDNDSFPVPPQPLIYFNHMKTTGLFRFLQARDK